ncbi:WxL domain-containing protein [Lactococcus kimchii]|uniref:WxL domain-containing protein n=1 Tax=Lactococcus sp. S-13 TaxID=2507158 RepID=UPI001022FCA4|nr:WxL domain-containing protein [Lactococcus sp. S-13]RZI49395.1 WxL domain-containing protein [Lactococcus sp. S-13]
MTKTTVKLVSFATLGLLAASVAAPLAHADETVDYGSTAKVAFEKGNGPVSPVDPSNPETPVTPVDPNAPDGKPQPGTDGDLTIDFASSFDFGTHAIAQGTQTYYAASQKLSDGTARDNYVQVTDLRGTAEGWSLNVKLGAFAGAAGTLPGSTVKLDNGAIQSASANPADTSATTTVLTPGVVSGTILGATAGTGTGTNLLNFGSKDGVTNDDSSVSITVPNVADNVMAGSSTADLTWTLADTPAN